jgi:hypothetical protein
MPHNRQPFGPFWLYFCHEKDKLLLIIKLQAAKKAIITQAFY